MPTVTAPQPPPQTEAVPWPTYGADNARTRSVTVPGLRPPFRRLWEFHGHTLLEFPPVAGYGLLYEEGFDGRIQAIDPATGAEQWSYYSRRCGWSSPALGRGLVFATFIGDARCSPRLDGEIVALSPRTGHVRWRRVIAKSESSPLLARGTVYFGDASGRVNALDAATGKTRWSYDTGAAVKASPALAGGRLFVGNYAGAFYALDARTGRVLWQNGGHGNFYAGASVEAGRVYVGSVDHSVYAFSARSGRQLWSFGTGGYVYASPAVWRGIVLVGSYDDTFYAINGATGTLRWDFHAGGRITGPASVIDGVVYFSTLTHMTYALDAASGRLISKWNIGEYSAAVAAGGHLYLIGVGRIYALAPR
jgi:outer membrane protein assembly factor BamB